MAGCCTGAGRWSCPSMLATDGLGLLRLLLGSGLGAACLQMQNFVVVHLVLFGFRYIAFLSQDGHLYGPVLKADGPAC